MVMRPGRGLNAVTLETALQLYGGTADFSEGEWKASFDPEAVYPCVRNSFCHKKELIKAVHNTIPTYVEVCDRRICLDIPYAEFSNTVLMVAPSIDNIKYFYYTTNALNYINCRVIKNTLKL